MIPEPASQQPRQEETFWNYEDLALFIGAWFPALAISLLLGQASHLRNEGLRQAIVQFAFYGLALAVLYILVAMRHHRTFWKPLGWRFDFRGAWICLLIGPPMAIGLAVLASLLRTPPNSPIPNLITDRLSMVAVLIFAVLAGPVFEETVFRGFLQPLLEKSMASWLAILLTAIPFGLLHGSEYGWAWQSIAIVALAGAVMGYARHLTGSTVASVLIHVGYNSTLFAGFLLQNPVAR